MIVFPCRETSISTVTDGKIPLEDLQKTMATIVPGTEVRNTTLKRVEITAGHHPQYKERIEADRAWPWSLTHTHTQNK